MNGGGTARTKNILCFGDSLTWGWIPAENPASLTARFSPSRRWTGVLQNRLGDGFAVIEEGLSGRTTNAPDPLDARLSGAAYLPACLATHVPLDLVVIMLGTNDAKTYFHRTPMDIATGMGVLLAEVAQGAGGAGTSYPAPRALVVCPPPTADNPDPWFTLLFDGARETLRRLPPYYEAVAQAYGADFFDAATVIRTDGIDGVHLTAATHEILGERLADVIAGLLR